MLAALPAIAYAIAYRVEVGYCRQFRIPTYLIKIALPEVLNTLAIMLFVLILLLVVTSLWYVRLSKRLNLAPIRRATFSALLWVLVFLVFLVLARPTQDEIFHSGLVTAVLWGILEVTSPKVDEEPTVLKFHLPSLQLMLAALCLLALLFSPTLGRGIARREAEFLVSTKDESLIVLRQYDQWWIIGKLSDDRKKLTDVFQIITPAAPRLAEAEAFQLKRIGPLRVTHNDTRPSLKRTIWVARRSNGALGFHRNWCR